MRWVGELARRKALKVGAVYLAIAWVLLQLTDIVAPALELPAWTLKLVLLLLALGFPVVMALAWQFNLTDHGLQADTGEPGQHPRARKRDWLLLGVIAALGVGLGVGAQRIFADKNPAVPTQARAVKPASSIRSASASVAVLPFVSMSGAVEDGYFADGLSEEVLNSLANVAGLKVAGRTSSFSYKGRDQDIRKIGRELGVAHVIEGSVRRQGDKLRVTAQLIKADDGFHLWSQTFDRTLDDALAIQSEIATAVADKLRLSVMPGTSAIARLDSGSQQAYLQALGLVGESSPQSLEQAVALLRPLQKAHPDFIPAYLPLADSVQRLGWHGRIPWVLSVDEMRKLSAEATRRAPRDLDVRVLAALIPFAENDLAPTYLGYERVLAAHRTLADEAPNHPLLQLNTADAARILDQDELALRYAERFVALEPRDPKGHMVVGQLSHEMGRDAEAIAAYRRSVGVAPGYIDVRWHWMRLLVRTGRYAEALDLVESCQREGAVAAECIGLLGDLYRVLRQPGLERETRRRSGFPMQAKYDAFEVQRRRGGYRAALAWVEGQGADAESIKRQFGDDLATAALEDGAYEELIELRRWLSPGVLDLDAPLLGWHLDAGNEVGVALRRLGREEQAQRMFRRVIEAAGRKVPAYRRTETQLPEATALAWMGRIDEAMAVIRREVANGWVCEYYMTQTNVDTLDPLIEPLRERKDFLSLMREVRERNAKAFAELKASGRPLIPDVKPAPPASAK